MNTTAHSLISIIGEDSETFLQGQVTCDMRELTIGECRLGACCDHKGRAAASFILLKPQQADIDFMLVLPPEMVDVFLDHIQKYAVFSKVTIAPCTDWQIMPSLENNAGAENFQLPGEPNRWLQLQPADTNNEPATISNAWAWTQLQAGFCFITPALSGKLIPLMLNYDKFGGVSFDKGCYLGQEVLARMHFRGQLKRHLHRLQLADDNGVTIGADVTDESQQPVGIITAIAQDPHGKPYALAVIRDAAINAKLYVNQQLAIASDL
ncbi:MAG: hypothetical protein P1U40_10220 [Coxiellaceae bacterium]|nr:hypothetical protein [Coxiellaceae bacterium]